MKRSYFYLIFSERDVARIDDGSQHSLNPIALTDEDVRKIKDEENFRNVYNETRKINSIKELSIIEVENTNKIKSE